MAASAFLSALAQFRRRFLSTRTAVVRGVFAPSASFDPPGVFSVVTDAPCSSVFGVVVLFFFIVLALVFVLIGGGIRFCLRPGPAERLGKLHVDGNCLHRRWVFASTARLALFTISPT